jgi:hypothetical protein
MCSKAWEVRVRFISRAIGERLNDRAGRRWKELATCAKQKGTI